jgi:hypothetical protein
MSIPIISVKEDCPTKTKAAEKRATTNTSSRSQPRIRF